MISHRNIHFCMLSWCQYYQHTSFHSCAYSAHCILQQLIAVHFANERPSVTRRHDISVRQSRHYGTYLVSVSTRLYILERQPTSTWHSMAMTESSLTDWLPCGLMMYNIVQLLLLLQKYIGWNDVTYLRSQYDRHIVGQHRRTVRS